MRHKDLSIEKEIHFLMAHKDNYDKIQEIIAGYKLPMLIKIAAEFYCFNIRPRCGICSVHDLDDMLKKVLSERRRRLNADFEWTDENKARFLFVNDQLYEVSKKGWDEAKETAAALEKRIKRRDSFLKDYEIEVTLNAYPKITGPRESAKRVNYYLAEKANMPGNMSISHFRYKHDKNEEHTPLMIDKKTNWNREYFNGEFENSYICYAIHWMLDTHVWSFPDILSIQEIWVDVNVAYQHWARVVKSQ